MCLIQKFFIIAVFLVTSKLVAQKSHNVAHVSEVSSEKSQNNISDRNSQISIQLIDLSNDFKIIRHFENPPLYINCENKYYLVLPKSGKKYSVRCIRDSTENHEIKIVKDSTTGIFSLIPEKHGNGKGKIGVFKNDKLVQEFLFDIKKVPPVEISVTGASNDINYLKEYGLNVYGKNKTLKFSAESKFPEFDLLCPKDSRYRVDNIQATLIKGRRPVLHTMVFRNGEVDLEEIYGILQQDTLPSTAYRLILEINDVYHVNYKNQISRVYTSTFILAIPLKKD